MAQRNLLLSPCFILSCVSFICLHLLSQLCSHLVVCHSKVEFLPGFNGPLPFELETGYIGVGDSVDVQLFYYFFESESNPTDDPLLLWLTGGPGCSTVSAILYENGPIKFEEVKYNGSFPHLTLNPHSWTKVASIIFVDMPVGTGFSYARTPAASYSSDRKAADHANQFLRKWLKDHRKFMSIPVYLGGDSYSGVTLPAYFSEMSKGNEEGMEPLINLKGYLLGNAVSDPTAEGNSVIPFCHGMGLISDELYQSLEKNCGGNYRVLDPSNVECMNNVGAFYKCITGLQTAHILEPLCAFASPMANEILHATARSSIYQYDDSRVPLPVEPSFGEFFCRADGYALAGYWFNDESVREALDVRKGTIGVWTRCNYRLNYTQDIESTVTYHYDLSVKGYRSLIYSGDHDMVVPFLGTQAWIRSLNFSIVDDWRSWHVDGQIAGYTRTYSNQMTFATVKGGGHTAPEYRPKECATMFRRWISDKPL
ncbi:hypothetical protein Ancab_016558 [Ancistrocladus abbreviatus]